MFENSNYAVSELVTESTEQDINFKDVECPSVQSHSLPQQYCYTEKGWLGWDLGQVSAAIMLKPQFVNP